MKTLNGIFLSKHDLLVKYSITDQLTYLEQTYTILMNHAGIGYWQCYNELIPPQSFLVVVYPHQFCPCFFGGFFSVLPSSFIASGVKSSRQYPHLILNVILFIILLTMFGLAIYQCFKLLNDVFEIVPSI